MRIKNKKGQAGVAVKFVLGIGLGAFIGYSITNTDLGAVVGAILGAYLASRF